MAALGSWIGCYDVEEAAPPCTAAVAIDGTCSSSGSAVKAPEKEPSEYSVGKVAEKAV